MNNLKRVLSLALSGIMLVGMMAVGASAAEFTDAEKIVNDEAVNVLVALGVVNGKEDGSYYDPEGDVSRAEIAKMVAVTMNGGKDTNTGTKAVPSFTDIAGHWAESYIEYCYDLGIISGRGDGTFDPEGKVTGLEATKMILTALGFDATAYKLVGASWAVRTDEVARTMTGLGTNEPKMYEGLGDISMAANASRDTTARLLWNGLQNRTRTVQPTTTDGGGVEWTYITNATSLLSQRFDANVSTGTFTGNYWTGNSSVEGEIEVMETWINSDGDEVQAERDFPSDFDISNIGEEVKVIWKDGTRGITGTLDTRDTIFGVFNTGDSKVVEATLADVKDNKSTKYQINIGGTKYDVNEEDGVDVIYNYGAKVSEGVTGNGTSSANSALTTELKKTNGDTLKAIINPNTNVIDTIYVTTSKLATVTAVNSSKVTMNNGVGAVEIEDNEIAEDLEKGDVVAVTVLYKEKAADGYVIVKKAETVEGEVDGWKDAKTVTVDGKAYNIYGASAPFMLTGSAIPDADVIDGFEGTGNDYIGESVALYLVNGYVAAAVQTSEAASNYSLVTEVKDSVTASNSAFKSLQLQVMDAEGTKTIITVDSDSPSGDLTENYAVGDIVTYTTTSSGTAKVKVEAEIDYSAKGAYDEDTKTFAVEGENVLTTTNAIVFVQTKMTGGTESDPEAAAMTSSDALILNGASYKVYSIRDLKTFDAAKEGMTVVTNKDDKVIAAFVNLQGVPGGATDETIYGIVTSEDGRVKDYYVYTVMANGEEYEVQVESNTKTLAKGDLVSFEKTSNDVYGESDVTVIETGAKVKAVYTKEAEDTTLTYYAGVNKQGDGSFKGYNQDTLALVKDAPIVYVDTKNDTSDAEYTIGGFDTISGYANAIILLNDEDPVKIKAVFIEVSNEEDINGVEVTAPELTEETIAAMPDGAFVPSDVTNLPTTAEPDEIMVFKFTGDGETTKFTLTISDEDGVVYTEAGELESAGDDGEAHWFWVAVGKLSIVSSGVAEDGNWKDEAAAPAGNYTYTITQTEEPKGVISSGSFVIAE